MRACVEELGEKKSRVPAGGEDDGGQARCIKESVDDTGGDISRIDLSNHKCIEEETGIGGETAGSGDDTFGINHRVGDAGSCLRQNEDEDGDGDGDEDGCEEGLRRDKTQGSRELASADAEGPPGSSTVFCAHISLWPLGRIEITIDEKARAGGNKVRPAALHHRKNTQKSLRAQGYQNICMLILLCDRFDDESRIWIQARTPTEFVPSNPIAAAGDALGGKGRSRRRARQG
jgi:hypothetical protein